VVETFYGQVRTKFGCTILSFFANGLLFWYQKGSENADGSLCQLFPNLNKLDGSDLIITEEDAMHV
jgi:hypothetical protein